MNRGNPILLCCWPGLLRLWTRGDWSALGIAIGFSVLLNLALVSSFVWPFILGTTFLWVAWPTIALVWILSAWLSYRQLDDEPTVSAGVECDADTLFIQAQNEYLKGDWKQSETHLVDQLDANPRDIEARLLLATIFRRTARWEKANRQLDTLLKFDASQAWWDEIQQEREFIQQGMLEEETVTDDHPEEPENEPLKKSNSSAPIRLGQFSQADSDSEETTDEIESLTNRRHAA